MGGWIPNAGWHDWPALLKQAIDEGVFPVSHAPFSEGEITVRPVQTWLISVPSVNGETHDIMLTDQGDIYTFSTRPDDGTAPTTLNDFGRKKVEQAIYLVLKKRLIGLLPTQNETPTE